MTSKQRHIDVNATGRSINIDMTLLYGCVPAGCGHKLQMFMKLHRVSYLSCIFIRHTVHILCQLILRASEFNNFYG